MHSNSKTFDVYKKLTKGCRFESVKKKRNEIEIKKRDLSLNSVKVKQEELCDDNNKDDIKLLSSINVNEFERKPKRQKVFDAEKLALLEKERVNQFRNEHSISVVGRHIADPSKSFDDLNVPQILRENLKKCGFNEPTAIQMQAIPVMLEGRQLLACSPTGSGKTLAFLIPIICTLKEPKKEGFRALILCPTKELAKQIQLLCIRITDGLGFHIHMLNRVNKAIKQYGPNSNGNFDILITTPNILCFLLKQNPPAINLQNIKWLIADEADKYFEESSTESFLEQFKLIISSCTNPNFKIAMFGATYTPSVAKWCVHNMKGLIRLTVGHRNSAVDLVDQSLKFVGNEKGKLIEIRNMIHEGFKPPVLVFVQSKERAKQLHSELLFDRVHVDVMHADLNHDERQNAIKNFREGKTWILICTELMARGIDFKGINVVVNYDIPQTPISYIHRVGRAGRAGRRGKAVTYFTIEDMEFIRPIGFLIKKLGGQVPDYILSLKKPSNKKKKQLKISVPKREDIVIKPVNKKSLKAKKTKLKTNASNKEIV